MSVVFVTNHDPALNYSGLSRYGTITYLTRGTAHPTHQNYTLDQIIGHLLESKSSDYLAISGNVFESTLAVIVWTKLHPSVRILAQDIQNTAWIPVPVHFSELGLQIERIRDLSRR